jgi:hypothetical protein
MSAPTALKPDALLSKPLPAANPVSWQWGRAAEEACRLEELFERFGREGAVGMSMGRPRATITRLPRAIWRAFLPAFPTRYVQGKPLTEVAMASAVVLPATDEKDWIVMNPFLVTAGNSAA